MYQRLGNVLLITAAVLLGVSLALHEPRQSSAVDTERFRFMAGVATADEVFCFGADGEEDQNGEVDDGWHDPHNWAADVFTDGSIPCAGGGSDETWLQVYGYSTFWDDFWMRAYIYDGDEGGVYDECKNLFVDVYRWLTGGIEEYLGSEWYMHLDTNPTNYGVQLWLGKNWWRLNSEYLGESATSEISGCPWTAVHVHQTIWPSFDDEYLQVDKNDQTFVQNGTYDQLDDIDDFIHHWQGWESPP